MDSTCGRRGSVVNAMSRRLFLLDFLKSGFVYPASKAYIFAGGVSWRAKSSYFSHASSHRENVAFTRSVGLVG